MKTALATIWLFLVFAGIATLFWYNDYIYRLPTPVPVNYVPVSTGKLVQLQGLPGFSDQKPVFLHFFNPDCPCSRFNIAHFKTLVKTYGNEVNFCIVVLNNTRYTDKQIQQKFDINLPIIFDSALAAACGVYSTPQAAILNNKHELYYRGNYNKSRYCTDSKTNYAQIALTTLLDQRPPVLFDKYALTAYGCQLPQCTKQ